MPCRERRVPDGAKIGSNSSMASPTGTRSLLCAPQCDSRAGGVTSALK